jgi:dienelactone hydrolase
MGGSGQHGISMSELTWLDSEHSNARDFSFDGPSRAITGALWLPLDFDQTTPLVLCGHGASGDRYQAPIPYLAKRFVATGMAVLAIDGPVHGLRQVGPGGREALAEEMRRADFIDDMVDDWTAALAAVREANSGIGSGALGYFGLSMGTIFGVPLLASAIDFNVAVIGLCGTNGAAVRIGERLASDATQIKHPVAFLMQLEDELFPRDGYLDLFDHIASADKRIHANPGLHPEVPAEEVDFAFDFLSARLTGSVERRIINPLAE